MNTPFTVAAAGVLAAATIAAAAGGPAAPAAAAGAARHHGPAVRTLPDSAVPFATAHRATGEVPGDRRLTVQLWLKPRTAAAESFATAVSTPGSPLFHRYLSPSGYTARFGATGAEAAGVASWLTSAGFSGVAADPQRNYVQATAPVATIDSAFGVRLKYYRPSRTAGAGRYPLRANDRAVSLPAAVAGSVLGVTGLDNAAPKMLYAEPRDPAASSPPTGGQPGAFPCSGYYAQHYAHGLPEKYRTVDFPTVICGYTADQLRRGYGYNRHNIGKGVTIALVEVGLTPDMFPTLQDYARVNRIQSPSAGRYAELSLGRGTACGDFFNVEEQLDVESSYDMAPLANQLVIGGDSCNNGFFGLQALLDADTAILNGVGGHPLAQIASNSWEGFAETQPASIVNIEHGYLLRAAAEGVSMLFSAGDGSGVLTPSSDPFATAVGGTTLGIGDKAARLFETGWSTGISTDINDGWVFQGEQGASGGGQSLLWAQPRYQRGVVPYPMARAPGNRRGPVRAVPDISAVADPFTGMAVGMLTFDSTGVPSGFTEIPVGGTSLAAPLVSGLVADAEQYQHHSFGFLNPALYRLAGKPAIHDALQVTPQTPARYHGVACDVAMCGALSLTTFDDESPGMQFYTGQLTRRGYDTMTGIGTPAGQNFVYALRDLG